MKTIRSPVRSALALGAVADGDGDCSDGIAAKLQQGLVAGKSKVQVKMKGQALVAPSLPLANDPSVVAQVRSTDGQCYGAVFSTPIINDDVAYRAKSD